MTKWNDEMVRQFYSTAHFYPDGRIIWMTEGIRYQSTISEWASLLGAPKEEDDDIDIYAKLKMDHNSMANMYTAIPQKDNSQTWISEASAPRISHNEHYTAVHSATQVRR